MRKGMQTQGLVEEAEMKIKMQVGEEKTMKEMQTEGLVEKGEAEKIGNEQNLALFLIASWNLGRKWSFPTLFSLQIFDFFFFVGNFMMNFPLATLIFCFFGVNFMMNSPLSSFICEFLGNFCDEFPVLKMLLILLMGLYIFRNCCIKYKLVPESKYQLESINKGKTKKSCFWSSSWKRRGEKRGMKVKTFIFAYFSLVIFWYQ
ncbi:hypothetical protein M9H77_19917 [Catharanthus roseus]|uniref:Uncharacterized protein n=1 Tax=Catharanthus roseus TaxID=4058 RepID=A0ACC0AID6_CATRO|nr:hypothetical protein M9H77_19917 [Catharanthus roseus]